MSYDTEIAWELIIVLGVIIYVIVFFILLAKEVISWVIRTALQTNRLHQAQDAREPEKKGGEETK